MESSADFEPLDYAQETQFGAWECTYPNCADRALGRTRVAVLVKHLYSHFSSKSPPSELLTVWCAHCDYSGTHTRVIKHFEGGIHSQREEARGCDCEVTWPLQPKKHEDLCAQTSTRSDSFRVWDSSNHRFLYRHKLLYRLLCPAGQNPALPRPGLVNGHHRSPTPPPSQHLSHVAHHDEWARHWQDRLKQLPKLIAAERDPHERKKLEKEQCDLQNYFTDKSGHGASAGEPSAASLRKAPSLLSKRQGALYFPSEPRC